MSSPCIFCQIVAKEAPGHVYYENDTVIVFKDIKPAASYHLLSCPKEHIENVNSLTAEHLPLLRALVLGAERVLDDNDVEVKDMLMGFHKPPFNSVGHLHLHVITPASRMSFISQLIFKPNTWWFSTIEDIVKKLGPENDIVKNLGPENTENSKL